MSTNDEVLSTTEAAKLLKYHPSVIRSYAKSGTIPATRIAGRWRFSRAKLLELLDSTQKEVK